MLQSATQDHNAVPRHIIMNNKRRKSRVYLNRRNTASASRQLTFLRVLHRYRYHSSPYVPMRLFTATGRLPLYPGTRCAHDRKRRYPEGVRRRFLQQNVPRHRRAEIGRDADSCMRRTESKCGSTIRACASTVRRSRVV